MNRVEIIAEVGSVHDGSFGNACKLVELAKVCGADIVKFQTHIAAAETLRDAPMPPYFKGEPRYEYFERTGFSAEQWRELRLLCEEVGIGFLSSPFSLEAVDLLEMVGVDCFKVASGEVTNLPLMERLKATGKRLILSSGMSNWAELDQAVEVCRGSGPLCVMQCSSLYPCPPSRVGLNILGEIAQRYDVEVGFSDHTDSNTAAIGAVFSGATVIEKHLTFSKAMYGSDAPNAAEPDQFRSMCDAVREAEDMRANPVDKNDTNHYEQMKQIFQKSIVAEKDLKRGDVLTADDLAYKKPGDGISAADYRSVIGRTLSSDLLADSMIRPEDLKD